MAEITINISDVVKSDNVKTFSNKTISYTQNNISVHSSGVIGFGGMAVLDYDSDILAYQAMGSVIKAQTVGLDISKITTSAALTSQNVFFVAVYLTKGETLTGIKWWQTTKGNYTGSNYNGVGLYTYSAGILTLVASSTNDAACWQTANTNTYGNKAFSSTYAASAGLYFIGFVWSSSATTTAPAIGASANSSQTAVNALDFTNSGRIVGTLAAQTSLPSPQALSGTVALANNLWVALY